MSFDIRLTSYDDSRSEKLPRLRQFLMETRHCGEPNSDYVQKIIFLVATTLAGAIVLGIELAPSARINGVSTPALGYLPVSNSQASHWRVTIVVLCYAPLPRVVPAER
jgi:hypothetical protein